MIHGLTTKVTGCDQLLRTADISDDNPDTDSGEIMSIHARGVTEK